MKNLFLVYLALYSFNNVISQEILVDYNLVSNTSTQIVIEVLISDNSPAVATKLSAMTTALNKTAGISGSIMPMWVEGPTFTGLLNPSPSMTTANGTVAPNGQVRATQSPIGSEGGSILLSSTPTLYATVTITSSTPISYPVTFSPNGTSGSGAASLLATKYDSDGMGGWNNVSSISFASGAIAFPDGSLIVAAPLPIIISDLKAKEIGKRNVINWSTESEINNDYQIVESSKDVSFGWRQVGKVKSKNSATGATYEVFDNNPSLLTYYRIRSVDFDGQEQLSDVVSVQRQTVKTSRMGRISPVPAVSTLNVDFELAADTDVSYKIIDAAGKIFIANTIRVVEGSSTQTIDINDLPSGTYTFLVSGTNLSASEQIIKVN
jgi:hypothetical protein